MKRAIIIGSGGQDGRYLFDRLSTGDNFIVGIERNSTRTHGASAGVRVPERVDILDPKQVASLVRDIPPDEIYYLAAFHHSAEDRGVNSGLDILHRSYETHVLGLIYVLEAIRELAPSARLFYAASSHVFGKGSSDGTPQNERTPFAPR